MVTGYDSIKNVWHRDAKDVWFSPVEIEEKIDGSQFSFNNQGCRSKEVQLGGDISKQFRAAYETARSITLPDNVTVRGEVLSARRHNKIMYDRVPKGNLIVWEVEVDGVPMVYDDKRAFAESIGLECVPLLYKGLSNPEHAKSLIGESCLGGKAEGVVIKGKGRVKIVSDEFKERMQKMPKLTKWGKIEELVTPTEALWDKAIQHCRDRGELIGDMKDIPVLMKQLHVEALADLDTVIGLMVKLMKSEASKGFPEYYKGILCTTVN